MHDVDVRERFQQFTAKVVRRASARRREIDLAWSSLWRGLMNSCVVLAGTPAYSVNANGAYHGKTDRRQNR
jgi:hypothetical protein